MIKTTPRPHQAQAIQSSVAELQTASLANIVMPCGTGKTLVGVAVADALQPTLTAVLAPSIALVSQNISAWRKEMGQDAPAFIAVCSDDDALDVGGDDVSASEVEGLVTTDVETLKSHLRQNSGQKIVIGCTYHSQRALGQALKDLGIKCDLAIYDEAHRTVSDGDFGWGVLDENLPAAKRLFMTATPKFAPLLSDRSLSMDNPAIYGRNVYSLPLAQAISQKLITDYQIIISVVSSDEISGIGDDIEQEAQAIAAAKAIRQFGLKKGFFFHRKISDARRMSQSNLLSKEARAALFHVNGRMSKAGRESVMQQFAEASVGIVTNARCLTEGIDVPAVDLVGFMSPKGSTVDIVQALGRSMRTHPGKECGYVLLPIFVNQSQGETIEQAIDRAGMTEVWNVLTELRDLSVPEVWHRSQRPVGADGVRATREFLDNTVNIIAEPVTVDAIRRAIDVQLVDSLKTPFDEKFAKIRDFMAEHGHLHLPPGSDLSKRLGKFISNCRMSHKAGRLSTRSQALLDSIGFPWSEDDATWQWRFVESTTKPGESVSHRTTTWLRQQREAFQRGDLSKDRVALLKAAGVELNGGRTRPRREVEAAVQEDHRDDLDEGADCDDDGDGGDDDEDDQQGSARRHIVAPAEVMRQVIEAADYAFKDHPDALKAKSFEDKLSFYVTCISRFGVIALNEQIDASIVPGAYAEKCRTGWLALRELVLSNLLKPKERAVITDAFPGAPWRSSKIMDCFLELGASMHFSRFSEKAISGPIQLSQNECESDLPSWLIASMVKQSTVVFPEIDNHDSSTWGAIAGAAFDISMKDAKGNTLCDRPWFLARLPDDLRASLTETPPLHALEKTLLDSVISRESVAPRG